MRSVRLKKENFSPFSKYSSLFCLLQKNRNNLLTKLLRFIFAEREGFEPPDLLQSTVFKTAAIDHSAISPATL